MSVRVVGVSSLELFRRHVGECAEDPSCAVTAAASVAADANVAVGEPSVVSRAQSRAASRPPSP